ncbi:hypothetical protein [Vibrio diazotrophicus]|uniref:hypothetical protein n=1 Tax=Vibrio diazotrophicus TaxID=685 RepID=UPI000C9E2766|nr:hypothetical protein [Vibrio diazotrophicus]PNH81235.1 hypothetical protein C1N27_06735 [Vibrio diazotrophicus]
MTHIVLDIKCEYCDFCFVGISYLVMELKKTVFTKCPNCKKTIYWEASKGDINRRIPENAVEVMYCSQDIDLKSKIDGD